MDNVLENTLGIRSANLRKLLFFESDPIASRESLSALFGRNTAVRSVNTTPGKLVDAAVSSSRLPKSVQLQLQLDLDSGEETLREAISLGLELFTHVPTAINEVCNPSEHNLIVDRLFAPDALHWDAFVHNYDFSRDAAQPAIDAAQEIQ